MINSLTHSLTVCVCVCCQCSYDNIHWTPQAEFCGLRVFHPYLTFAGHFEHLRAHGDLLAARARLEDASECPLPPSAPFPPLLLTLPCCSV
jgi:hypothetical protein